VAPPGVAGNTYRTYSQTQTDRQTDRQQRQQKKDMFLSGATESKECCVTDDVG
jgi:hypothetical protein